MYLFKDMNEDKEKIYDLVVRTIDVLKENISLNLSILFEVAYATRLYISYKGLSFQDIDEEFYWNAMEFGFLYLEDEAYRNKVHNSLDFLDVLYSYVDSALFTLYNAIKEENRMVSSLTYMSLQDIISSSNISFKDEILRTLDMIYKTYISQHPSTYH